MDERRHQPERRQDRIGGRRASDNQALRDAIGGRIQIAMNRRQLTVILAADLAGVAEGTMRRVLAGKNVSLDTLAAIADAMEIDLTVLVRSVGKDPQYTA